METLSNVTKVFQKLTVEKTIVFRFLKVQNERFVFKNDSFSKKRKDRFLQKTKRSATLIATNKKYQP